MKGKQREGRERGERNETEEVKMKEQGKTLRLLVGIEEVDIGRLQTEDDQGKNQGF